MNRVQAKVMSLGVAARFGAFVGCAVLAGPIFTYLFGALTDQAIVSALPFVAVGLITISYLFGLLNGAAGILVGIGAVLWSLIVAFCSPAIVLFAMCFGREMLHVSGTCFT